MSQISEKQKKKSLKQTKTKSHVIMYGQWSLVNLVNICLQCLFRNKSRVHYFMYFFISFCMISSWSTYSKMYGVCISIPMLPNIVTVRNTISRSRSKTLATNFQSSSTCNGEKMRKLFTTSNWIKDKITQLLHSQYFSVKCKWTRSHIDYVLCHIHPRPSGVQL